MWITHFFIRNRTEGVFRISLEFGNQLREFVMRSENTVHCLSQSVLKTVLTEMAVNLVSRIEIMAGDI